MPAPTYDRLIIVTGCGAFGALKKAKTKKPTKVTFLGETDTTVTRSVEVERNAQMWSELNPGEKWSEDGSLLNTRGQELDSCQDSFTLLSFVSIQSSAANKK